MTISNWLDLEKRIRQSSYRRRILVVDPDRKGRTLRRAVVWRGGKIERAHRRAFVRVRNELREVVGYYEEEEIRGRYPVIFIVK